MALENPSIIILKNEGFTSNVLPIDAELLETPFSDRPEMISGKQKPEFSPEFSLLNEDFRNVPSFRDRPTSTSSVGEIVVHDRRNYTHKVAPNHGGQEIEHLGESLDFVV